MDYSDWIIEYFMQKYHYKHANDKSHLQTNHDELKLILQQINEQYSHLKRSINEIKAMQHFILEILENKQ